MGRGARFSAIALFCARFAVLAPACLALWWWLVVPPYVWALGQVCAWTLIHVAGMPIEALKVTSAGILNTETILVFVVDSRDHPIAVAHLVNNLPPFVILVLATSGLGVLRRLKVLGIGTGILVVCHAVFIVLVYVLAERIEQAPVWPVALGKFLLTLPFLLWIVLAYWEHVTAFFGDGRARNGAAEREKKAP